LRIPFSNVLVCTKLTPSSICQTHQQKIALLREASASFSRSKRANPEQQVVDQQVELLTIQNQYETELGIPFNGSIHATISKLIEHGQVDKAGKMKSKFQIPDKRYSWLMVRALVNCQKWAELEQYGAGTRRPPIGYLPFVTQCIAAGALEEAKKYMYVFPAGQ
jgi:hypothetical protein